MKRPTSIVLLLLGLAVLGLRPAVAEELLVFAASSLREPFQVLGRHFASGTGRSVVFNFAGSQMLRTQIAYGAPADVYAAADPRYMLPLLEQGLVETPSTFAGNRLSVLLSPRATGIATLADLGRPGVQLAVGSETVPVGRYTRRLLASLAHDPEYGPELVAGIRRNIRTEESSVKAIVAKVLLDEVDAGFVYRSDRPDDRAGGRPDLALPDTHNPVARYPVAVLKRTRQPEAARAFVALLLSPEGQMILRRHRFLPADAGKEAE